MARKIIIKKTKDEDKKENKTFSAKPSKRVAKVRVGANGKIISSNPATNNHQRKQGRVKETVRTEDKYVLYSKKQRYERNPELYISEGAPIMTFDKNKSSDKSVLENKKRASSYSQKNIGTRTPTGEFQEYKSERLEHGGNNILYKGKVYEIKDKNFSDFIKKAEISSYDNLDSRKWARRVAKGELDNNGVRVDDIRLIVLPVDLKINGRKIDLPEYDEEGLEKSVYSAPIPTMGF